MTTPNLFHYAQRPLYRETTNCASLRPRALITSNLIHLLRRTVDKENDLLHAAAASKPIIFDDQVTISWFLICYCLASLKNFGTLHFEFWRNLFSTIFLCKFCNSSYEFDLTAQYANLYSISMAQMIIGLTGCKIIVRCIDAGVLFCRIGRER